MDAVHYACGNFVITLNDNFCLFFWVYENNFNRIKPFQNFLFFIMDLNFKFNIYNYLNLLDQSHKKFFNFWYD